MGFGEAIRSVLSKYFQPGGRAPRSEYWYWTLFTILVFIVLAMIDGVLFASAGVGGVSALSGLASLAFFIPNIMVTIRRLHDTDRSGWWILIAFIPFIGFIVLLIFMILRGTEGANRFGDDPLMPGGSVSASVFE